MDEMTLADLHQRESQRGYTAARLAPVLTGAIMSLLALPLPGCFDGSQAEGLPCESNEDCGPALSCQNNCCGGDCRVAPTASGVTTEVTMPPTGSTSTGTLGTSIDPTVTIEPCGDGVRADDEICDDDADENCVGCEWDEDCGNETVDPGEVCDPTAEADPKNGLGCNAECSAATLFFWDVSGTQSPIGTEKQNNLFSNRPDALFAWRFLSGAQVGSGTYYEDSSPRNLDGWPEAELQTRLIEAGRPAGELAGLDVVVSLEHKYRFNNSNPPGANQLGYTDHGRVILERQGERTSIYPLADADGADVIDCYPDGVNEGLPYTGTGCLTATPVPAFCEPAGMIGLVEKVPANNDGTVRREITLDAESFGTAAKLGFLVRYDCANFGGKNDKLTDYPPDDDAWQLFELRVTLETRPG